MVTTLDQSPHLFNQSVLKALQWWMDVLHHFQTTFLILFTFVQF